MVMCVRFVCAKREVAYRGNQLPRTVARAKVRKGQIGIALHLRNAQLHYRQPAIAHHFARAKVRN
jgi:hypothetical protein